MAFRFIHTADIHLDSPLKSLAMRNEALKEIVSNATRQVFVRIVDLCLSESVDALLIAGDLYDGSQTSMKTARFLASQLRRLNEAEIAVYIIRGNHDAESKITRELTLPSNVHVFGSKAQSQVVPIKQSRASALERPVLVHGASFKKPHAPDSLLPLYAQPDPSAINIGMMHTSLDGAAGHDLYAPCSLADLQGHGYDYWALGHIHKRAIHTNKECTVVMPGIPQGRDIGESGAKSVSLVTISDDGAVDVEEHVLALAQFEQVEVPLDSIDEWSAAINVVVNSVEQVAKGSDVEHFVARIVLTGQTSLAWRLRRDQDFFVEEINSRFEDESVLWLDKVVIKCEPLVTDVSQSANGLLSEDLSESPFQELYELMINEIQHSPDFQKDAEVAVDELINVLPASLRSHFMENEERIGNVITVLAMQGSTSVAAALNVETEADESAGNSSDGQV